MKNTLTATKARQIFFKLIARAKNPGHAVTITVDGEPQVVMMSADEFDGWMETLEIMSDPKLVKGIKRGMKDFEEGRFYTHEEVKKMFKIK